MFIYMKCLLIIGGILLLPFVAYILLRNPHVKRMQFALMFAGYFCVYLFLAGVLTADLPPSKIIKYNLIIQIVNFVVSIPIAYLAYPILFHIVSKRNLKK